MLELIDIKKDYETGDTKVAALKGINLRFRDCEFVSILGQSGCGKTTMLNIIGGLDKYTSGDLRINGVSTKDYKDRDWDAYRNNSIGFVFQSYNLIPHQTVLSNVELALTLSGVSKAERRKRAVEALEKVGLGEQIHKKPNQMSGGQMQRVAIARALVNNPDILLADEPTGALDTETSVQIMELLKEISKDRLIIMVTHNPELAMKYSTRIVRLLDGTIVDDSDPYTEEQLKKDIAEGTDKSGTATANGSAYNSGVSGQGTSISVSKTQRKKKPKTSMSFFTALSLSFNNLMTKKTRTILTAFAGSIGIIGIALILSISNGIQLYIDRVQRDTLSSYPIQLQSETVDISSMVSSMTDNGGSGETHEDMDKIYSNNIMSDMMNTMVAEVQSNNLNEFKHYIENGGSDIKDYASAIEYTYDIPVNIYKSDTSDKVTVIINAISYVLIAFVGISLIVSSIMIGIITYISVLERTKEIGILRSIGASKKDISRIFNAETLIEGFVAGALGIIITLILCVPANAIIKNVTSIANVAQLPVAGGVILVIISMLLRVKI
jgi:putative ABC transport system permease protein